jgi:hypothetical protein
MLMVLWVQLGRGSGTAAACRPHQMLDMVMMEVVMHVLLLMLLVVNMAILQQGKGGR